MKGRDVLSGTCAQHDGVRIESDKGRKKYSVAGIPCRRSGLRGL
jgi:hypothetical protein